MTVCTHEFAWGGIFLVMLNLQSEKLVLVEV